MVIEQAIYGSRGAGGYRFLARSPGFLDDWLPEAERLCTGFGERPAGVSCPGCVFARPFGPGHVAVVQVADQGRDDAGRPGALGFRLLILPHALYDGLGGDPFAIADRFPPSWDTTRELPALEWTAGVPPRRTVDDLRQVLDVPHSATLLGGVQVLLDGGRLVFERIEPDPRLLRSLWALLPYSTRSGLWPASFAFSNAHHFDALVVPRASGPDYATYLHEVQAGDYPEGRYELSLQTAVEAGDQREVDALLSRRSRAQTFRLAAGLLAVFLLVPLGVLLLGPSPPPEHRPSGAQVRSAGPNLPPADACPALPEGERRELAKHLRDMGRQLGVTLPRGDAAADLAEDLARLDARLGTPDPRRDPGKLSDLGPLQRQLRALLWKHGVPGYDGRGLNTVELAEKLKGHLAGAGALKEQRGE